MDLSYTAEEQAFRAEVRAFLEAEVPEETRAKLRLGRRLCKDDMVRWQRILHRRGWGAGMWPKRFGGAGWSVVQQYIFEEESAAASAPPQIPFGLRMVAPVIMTFGNAAQQQRFLPRIVAGEDWWCQGYSEPGSGSDLASLRMSALRAGRSLPGQWAEDLEYPRSVRRLDLLSGTHLQRGAPAAGHLLFTHRYEDPRRQCAPDHHPGR